MNKKSSAKMSKKLKWLYHNDHHEINNSETYRFLLNFEKENAQLKYSDGSKCDKKLAKI